MITGFSANHVIIVAPSWPGTMAHAYCDLRGKAELLVSRPDDRTFHFACLAPEYLAGDDEDELTLQKL